MLILLMNIKLAQGLLFSLVYPHKSSFNKYILVYGLGLKLSPLVVVYGHFIHGMAFVCYPLTLSVFSMITKRSSTIPFKGTISPWEYNLSRSRDLN